MSAIRKKNYSISILGPFPVTKSILFFILFFALQLEANAQKAAVDSLRKALANSPAEKKIDAYQALIQKFWLNQPDSAMRYAMEAVAFTSSRSAREKAIAF